MANLNLNSYGVTELTENQLINVEGGNGLLKWIANYVGGKALDKFIEEIKNKKPSPELEKAMQDYINSMQNNGMKSIC